MSQSVKVGGIVYISGQVADSASSDICDQTRQVLGKIDVLLGEAGSDRSHLISVEVYLPNIADFDAMNIVYDAWVDKANLPARACIEARLADPNLRVEIKAVAAVRD